MTIIAMLDDGLAEACMMRAAHLYICEVRGIPVRFRPLAMARAELWADRLSQPETRLQAWVTMDDLEQQTRKEWTSGEHR